MRLRIGMACIVALLALTGAASAAGSLSIRLVQASNRGQGVGDGLSDVAELLRGNMPFNTYALLATRSLALPADGAMPMGEGLTVRCSGRQGNLQVTVTRDGRAVLQTTVELQDGIPLIVGGIPTERGKLIFILLAR